MYTYGLRTTTKTIKQNKYKYVISTAPLTPIVTSGALTKQKGINN